MAPIPEVKTATRVIRKNGPTAEQIVNTDICVVGAGIAGVSAALEAARLGHKVVLVDSLPVLGGQAANSSIGGFCGLLSNGPKPYQFTHGIADDILRDLGAIDALQYRYGAWNVVVYDDIALARWIEEAVRKAGITVILGAILHGVTMDERRIQSIELVTRYGDLRVTATAFVDATGDAALTWQAGLPCRESAAGPIYGSQMVVLEGIEMKKPPESKEQEGIFAQCLREKAEQYGLPRKEGFAFYFPARGTVRVNMTHIETPMETLANSEKTLEAKTQADQVVHFLKSEFPEIFGNAKIHSYGLLGIRQTRWIVGRQQLTVADVRSGKRFPDAIARTAWGIELHDRPDVFVWETFPADHIHYVPFGSLTPPDCDNLVAIGRCIDADLAALSSVRVNGPCIAMGAAAAHALNLAGSGSVHEIDIAALQARLQDNLERNY